MRLSNIREVIRHYLTERALPFIEKPQRFLVPIRVCDITIYLVVNIGDPWIEKWAPLIKTEALPRDLKKDDFYARLLQDTLYLREVTYGLTKNRDVAVRARNAFSLENFISEFGSVIYGVKHFL
jgi:hypothetical protein